MSIQKTAFKPWDLERVFYGNPFLSKTERCTAVHIIKSWDKKFRPIDTKIASQALVGHWIGCWRSTVNKALRKLVVLGYFRTTWKSVQRLTKQGIKGVTRVYVTPGPELKKLLYPVDTVSAGQAHGETPSHPSQALPGRFVPVRDDVVAKSADRSGEPASNTREFRRKTLAEWPRLAGSKPISADRLPSAVRYADYVPSTHGAEMPGYTELSDEEAYARVKNRLDKDVAARGAAAARQLLQRNQPRRQPPRSKR